MTQESGEDWSTDPGWRPSWKTLILAMPYARLLYRRRSRGDQLIDLRNVYASFPLTLVAFGVVLPFILPLRTGSAAIFWLLGVALLTVLTTIAVHRIVRPLPCDSDARLAAGFRARMYLRVAFADSTALFGFVAAFVTTSSWVYYVCVLMAAPGLSRAAPTRAALIRAQDALNAQGCGRSLVAALRQTPAKPK